ncbi:MAG: hypothetical protein ACKV2Q_27495 [Planctomycetaceae bacterium]
MTPNTIHLAETTKALVDEAARQAGVEDDDFLCDLIESNAEIRAELARRQSGKFLSVDEALQQMKG